jgi:putative transposase
MMYLRFPLSLRNVEVLLHERGIDISHETGRFRWNRFGPMFVAELRRKRVSQMRAYSNLQWHLDEVFVKINGETHHLWRAMDHEGEVLESFVTKRRDHSHIFVTDRLSSYAAAMKVMSNVEKQETGRCLNN